MNAPINRREFLGLSSIGMAVAVGGALLTPAAEGLIAPQALSQAAGFEVWLLKTGRQELAPALYTYVEHHLLVP